MSNSKLIKVNEVTFEIDGSAVPKELEMDLNEDSGVFFGMMPGSNRFVGKPDYEDGHILVVGGPGSGKTMGMVVPTMMTWRGIQIIIDVKGNLYSYWKRLNKYTSKKIMVFGPGEHKDGNCYYDPYAFLQNDGTDNLAGNARDLALALMPLVPAVNETVWIQTTQNFLTGAIIYYFDLGNSFNDTMSAIQTLSITDLIETIMESNNMAAKVYMSKLSDVNEKVIVNIGMELSKLATLVTDPAIKKAFSSVGNCELLDWQVLNTATEPFDIILEIPEANLERWEPMILLMINQLIKSLEQRPERTYKKDSELPPVLVMLDEFPRLGNIHAIKHGLCTLRSRGVTFVLFVQSLASLEEIYGSTASRVIADTCSYKIILSVSDTANQEYFSKAVGTFKSKQSGISINRVSCYY
jgi:type IV secretion system protein VirD4